MRLSKKFAAIAITATVALTATAAFAFWSSSGSGTGTGSAAPAVAAVNAVQDTTLTAMYPGDTVQTISGHFTNAGAPAYVANLTASISSVTGGTGGCLPADFSLTTPVVTVGHLVTNLDPWTGPGIQFNNTASNQDNCKSAVVHLLYTVNAS